MAKYKFLRRSGGRFRRLWISLAVLLVVMSASAVVVHKIYSYNLGAVSSDQQTQIFTVKKGSTFNQVGAELQDAKLIRSAWALNLYIHSKELDTSLQAGTYALSPSESMPDIVATLTKGSVATNLVTILPGRRIDQVRSDLINDGFTPAAVDLALLPDQYNDMPALASKPGSVQTLEGLLWPDSYQKDASTDPRQIIRASLTEMAGRLTPDVQAALAAQGLTPYQGLTLASIIEQEVSKPTDRAQASQVFLSRFKAGISLGSDVTANYGAIAAGRTASLTYDSPYNTLLHTGWPPSPISTVSLGSLQAAAHPASTDWLFFVAGDDGTTYFSKTLEEHEALAQKYCHKLCGR